MKPPRTTNTTKTVPPCPLPTGTPTSLMGAIRKYSSSARIEDQLTARVHHRVGGPSKLAKFADASLVRTAVLRALADEQSTIDDNARIQRGELTPLERRVVRTVTNRGAAVRSRERTRQEVESLRAAIADRDARIAHLTSQITAVRAGVSGTMEGELAPVPVESFPPNGPTIDEQQMPATTGGFPGQSFLAPSLDRAAFSAIIDSLT